MNRDYMDVMLLGGNRMNRDYMDVMLLGGTG